MGNRNKKAIGVTRKSIGHPAFFNQTGYRKMQRIRFKSFGQAKFR
jgi:hypothetical protein